MLQGERLGRGTFSSLVRQTAGPGCGMLVDGRYEAAEGPSVDRSGAHPVEDEVFFLAFDGTFGTGACVFVLRPEGGVSRDGSTQAGIAFRIGVDGASIGGRGARLGERTCLRRGAGKGGAPPFDPRSVGTESPGTEGTLSWT